MLHRRAPFALLLLVAAILAAQSAPKFDVASIKPNRSGNPPTSNFPLGPGDVYVRNGGYLSATGFLLTTYMAFAYKIIGNQAQYLLPQLPQWAKTDRYDIQARAEGDPGKDQMRLMMRSLLADRFQLVTHYEDREVPVLAFALVRAGKTGPHLQLHSDDAPCPTEQPTAATPGVVNGLPAFCNGIYPLPASAPGRFRFGGRRVTLAFIADAFSSGVNLGRPLVDRTGLAGSVDFSLEWVQESGKPLPPGAEAPSDTAGPTFQEALRDQLGIKLVSTKAPLRILVIDRVERPTEN